MTGITFVSSAQICFKVNFYLLFAVAEGPYADVVKLQTMRCLFEAYEHVLSLLETVFTPMFCHSDEVSIYNKHRELTIINGDNA